MTSFGNKFYYSPGRLLEKLYQNITEARELRPTMLRLWSLTDVEFSEVDLFLVIAL